MKKFLLLLFVTALLQIQLTAQNIGINATGALPNASAILDVSATNKGVLLPRMTTAQRLAIATPVTGLLVFDIQTSSFWYRSGQSWIELENSSNPSWRIYDNNLYSGYTGNVGIGTGIPTTKLEVVTGNNSRGISHTNLDGTIHLSTQIGGSSAGIGTFSPTNMRLFANGVSRILIAEATGNIGIGTDDPTNKMQIGILGGTGFNGNDFAIGNGTQALSFSQSNSNTAFNSSTDIVLRPKLFTGGGNVGINVATPVNKLQIGSVGSAGFNGNDLAIGNGSQAMVIYQSNNSTLLASTTDIILNPRNNGQGRVGINTLTPRAALDVSGSVVIPFINYAYYAMQTSNFKPVALTGGTSDNPDVSIYAANRVMAPEFDAYSDIRIKEITGISNPEKDLKIINALRITDYTMKDKVKYGGKVFKKVIAQEVEKVYPQIVSRHTDFIPNVYQLTNSVKRTERGLLLHFTVAHHLDSNAKKLQAMITETNGLQVFDIVAIPSASEIIISAGELKTDKIFVYGQEVSDFRTVDYEGLTTLNISATQEISRQLRSLKRMVTAQQQQIRYLQSKQLPLRRS